MVSVIIPTFNYSHYLSETLNSVKNQSYKNLECIVIDDGSTDNTKEIFNTAAGDDNRFKYFYQQNRGISSARNSGLKHAIGDYIQFLDSDDLIEPDKIKSQVEIFEINTNFDIVYSNFKFFDDKNYGNFRASLKGDKSDNWMPKFSTSGKEIVNCLSKINFLVVNSPLIRKRTVDKIGFFNERMKGLEDRDFWMRCAISKSYFHYHEGQNDLALVRTHGDSLSTKKKVMNNGYFLFLIQCISNKELNIISKFSFCLKYVEHFWDSIFNLTAFKNYSLFLSLASILLFPIYILIKIVRLFRKN
jgi:glycosyltransferase involved in cell wall biosynthesis